ncbi:MAG: heavy-metal-associated domain-containing protein [Bacteroidetes bacterium]|nr:heavy-metal-associated domain-containing protein [Bacteroidota bacterium]
MNKKSILIAAVMLTINVFAFGQKNKDNPQTVTIKTNIYCSHCMQCGRCAPRINDHITENSGIKKVSIDAKANTITVAYDAKKTSPEKIREAINKAGFDADDKKATAEAVNNLDGCCRKQ